MLGRVLTPLLLLLHGDALLPLAQTQQYAHAHGLPPARSVSWPPPSSSAKPNETRREFCPRGMVLVEGNYCPSVQHRCIDWLDNPKLPYARCGRYDPTVSCQGSREYLKFCIDREEFTLPGEALPENLLSLNQAMQRCLRAKKRVCFEREWTFACEGEEMRPYPYGWSREAKCNHDRQDLFEMRNGKQVLRDHRALSRDFPECVSPFGVANMVGNLDEPVVREGMGVTPPHTTLKGGWWMPARNRCRPATTAHDAYYRDVQTGARCCADAADEG